MVSGSVFVCLLNVKVCPDGPDATHSRQASCWLHGRWIVMCCFVVLAQRLPDRFAGRLRNQTCAEPVEATLNNHSSPIDSRSAESTTFVRFWHCEKAYWPMLLSPFFGDVNVSMRAPRNEYERRFVSVEGEMAWPWIGQSYRGRSPDSVELLPSTVRAGGRRGEKFASDATQQRTLPK